MIGVNIQSVSQSMTTLSPAAKYFEELVMSDKINLGQNPVFRYNNSNARLKFSNTSNLIRIVKDKDLNPIDSIISTIVALRIYMSDEFNELNLLIG